jgi:hypothetical protein
MSRSITFKLDKENRLEINFGIYCIMMYYAAQVNPIRAKKLMESSISEANFRFEYNLEDGGVTPDEDAAHYVYSDIQDIVPFINNEVIPALTAETYDEILDDKYGGKENFFDSYYESENYLGFFGVNPNELFDGNKYSIRGEFKSLRDFFQVVIQKNKVYEVWVN